jgi:hypothetical protein
MGGLGGGSKGPASSGGASPDLSARPTAEVARELGADLRAGLASAEAAVRERSRFWKSAPSGVLLAALAVDAAVGAALPLADLPGLRPIPAVQTLAVVAAAALLTLGLNDAVKTALVRRAGLAPAAGPGGAASPAP